MISLEDFNIDYDFPKEVRDIANRIKFGNLKKKYKSAYDYIGIMYYFRFVEKLEKSLIAEKLNIAVTNMHIRLYDLRWNFSDDYYENQRLYNEFLKKVEVDLEEAKQRIREVNFNRFKDFRNIMKKINVKKVRSHMYRKQGISNADEYIKILYYLVKRKENSLTTRELAVMFDVYLSTMQLRLKNLGLNIPHKEAIEKKKFRGLQDYEKTARHGKMTRMRNIAEHCGGGSKNENYFRSYLSAKIYDFFPSEKFDIVVGVNTTGLLGPKEIDIPLIIYDRDSKFLYKFAIEYNGELYHQEDDLEKRILAQKRGWIYIPIVEAISDRSSNENNILNKKVISLCEKIKKCVQKEVADFSCVNCIGTSDNKIL